MLAIQNDTLVTALLQENVLLNIGNIWELTPTDEMPMLIKFYWLLVIAFVLHQFPEMYFMRVKSVIL